MGLQVLCMYHDNSKHWDSQAWVNNVDTDQILQNTAYDQSLYCLALLQQVFYTWRGSKMDQLKF